jgi:transposase-like protein
MKGAFMSHKTKYSPEFKISVARRCIEGSLSLRSAAKEVGTSSATIHKWVAIYRFQGEYGFFPVEKNRVYSEDFRLRAVLECINEHSSPIVVAAKYGIRSCSRLEEWIKMYNNGEDFSHKMSGGSRMKTSRSTTKEERIQIVKDCIANVCNYGEMAIKHNVSYQQVYGWVQRYKELGESGLEDRRGKRNVNQEPRSEVEKLQIEIEKLKHQLYMTEMERDLLKKLNELEREELFRK